MVITSVILNTAREMKRNLILKNKVIHWRVITSVLLNAAKEKHAF